MSSMIKVSPLAMNGPSSTVHSHPGMNSGRVNETPVRDSVAGVIGSRFIRESGVSSPLQVFVQAKKKINDIFQVMEEFVNQTSVFINGIPKDEEIATEENVKEVNAFASKVGGIREVLARDHMKVAFFGRTSNGKSTVINAMLGEKILPSGIGHTTNCFLQVEGDDTSEPYLMCEGSNERQNIDSISNLAHALCNNRLGDSTLIRIHWPKSRCQLLRDDVVLVDSPGIDVSESLDEWIDKHCLDADVFVLVANSESTLMNTEKNFFHKVSAKLSKPNIFVLQNRWDMAASEPEFLNEVRKQHTERTVDFLANELKVSDQAQAEQRVFFVSAKETLLGRFNESKGAPANSGMPEGFSSRYFEFQDFERRFEECISKTAVVTKFDQHTQRGRAIANDIQSLVHSIEERCSIAQDRKSTEKVALMKKVDCNVQELLAISQDTSKKVATFASFVERMVSEALNEEIRRLSVLVNEFSDPPFNSDPLTLNVFKKALHAHVEAGLGSNLCARLSSVLALNVEANQREMTDRMMLLLKEDKREMVNTLLPQREPFNVFYRLNCENLFADFQEDIEFKFSLGIVSMVRNFVGFASNKFLRTNPKDHVHRGVPMTPMTPSNDPPSLGSTQEDWSLVSRFAIAAVGSQGTMGLALALGLMFKTVGWRVILATGAVYGSLYAYERLTFTNKAKERLFKKQYVDHATRKLRLIVDLTSVNCSHQVKQELCGTFGRLCRFVQEDTKTMKTEAQNLDKEVVVLKDVKESANMLMINARRLINEFTGFQETYLNLRD